MPNKIDCSLEYLQDISVLRQTKCDAQELLRKHLGLGEAQAADPRQQQQQQEQEHDLDDAQASAPVVTRKHMMAFIVYEFTMHRRIRTAASGRHMMWIAESRRRLMGGCLLPCGTGWQWKIGG